jgi:hypothetical protein
MKKKRDMTVLEGSPRFCRDAMYRVFAGGLKARKSLVQGNALWHGRYLSTPEALNQRSATEGGAKGQNLSVRIAPFQGLAFERHSFRMVIELAEICAIDYRAFSPYYPKTSGSCMKTLCNNPETSGKLPQNSGIYKTFNN